MKLRRRSDHVASAQSAAQTALTNRASVDCSTLTGSSVPPETHLPVLDFTITLSHSVSDLHHSHEVPEVEIISLLGEELPRYKLRADYLTEFGGCENKDFQNLTIEHPLRLVEIENTLVIPTNG